MKQFIKDTWPGWLLVGYALAIAAWVFYMAWKIPT